MCEDIDPLKNKISMFKAKQKYFINVYEGIVLARFI